MQLLGRSGARVSQSAEHGSSFLRCRRFWARFFWLRRVESTLC